jgi:tRNA A-37 threonylcarbamoyl transferase component Bud32
MNPPPQERLAQLERDLHVEKARLDFDKSDLRSALAAQAEVRRKLSNVGWLTSASTRRSLAEAAALADRQVIAQNASIATQNASIARLDSSIKDLENEIALSRDFKVRAVDFLRTPLQAPRLQIEALLEIDGVVDPVAQTSKQPKTSTSLEGRRFAHRMPHDVRQWAEFRPSLLAQKLGDTLITNPREQPVKQDFDTEKDFIGYWIPPRTNINDALAEAFPEGDHPSLPFAHIGFSSERLGGDGATDEFCYLGGNKQRSLEVTEFKTLTVPFHLTESVAALYQSSRLVPHVPGALGNGPKGNTLKSLVQTFTYMVSGNAVCDFGCFTNWRSWVFMKRVNDGGKEVLYVSDWYGLGDARLAFAHFLYLCVESAPQPTASLGTCAEVPWWLRKDGQDPSKPPDKDKSAGGKQSAPHTTSTSAGNAGGGAAGDNGGSAKGKSKKAPLDPDTTTTEALGIDAIIFVRPFELLSKSSKSHTRRVTVNGRDLVAKIVDFHGTPKHSEWSAETLYELEQNEVRTYRHLKAVQGRLVPEFLYHGSDFNFMWATAVTTYEGKSLDDVAEEGGFLNEEVKAKALAGLRELHALGVVHGDLALRNAVWRERDGAVLWLDFEMARVRGKGVPADEFASLAEQEEAELQVLLDGVPGQAAAVEEQVEDSSVSAAAASKHDEPISSRSAGMSHKRSKVIPLACCF